MDCLYHSSITMEPVGQASLSGDTSELFFYRDNVMSLIMNEISLPNTMNLIPRQ